eukprot:1144908-Pelagomonas_calceolata.AAC.11
MEQLFSWGKLKTSGDNQMYPIQDQNMTGVCTCVSLSTSQCCSHGCTFGLIVPQDHPPEVSPFPYVFYDHCFVHWRVHYVTRSATPPACWAPPSPTQPYAAAHGKENAQMAVFLFLRVLAQSLCSIMTSGHVVHHDSRPYSATAKAM